MSRNLSVTEPHPSVVKSGGFIGSGRGGAGNYKHYKSADLSEGPNASGPAARVNIVKPSKRTVMGGRGGAGNMFRRVESEEQIFQFDEEMVKRRESAAPTYHIGRGGAANWIDESKPWATRRTSSIDSSDSQNSDRSNETGVRRSVEVAFGRFSRKLSKN